MTEQNQLVIIANEAGLAEDKSKQLLASFGNLFNDARQAVKFAKDIVVNDVSQVEEMSNARKTRLELKSIRVQVENTRKTLKEQSLREGKAIDGIANVIKALIVPVEQYLEDQEKFAERIEAERKNKIELERVSQLLKYVDEAENYSLHPDQMSEETFNKLLDNSRLAFEARKKAEEEAEKERLALIEAEKEEQERIRQENIKLRAEAEKREKELAKERAEQQRKLEAEQKARKEAEDKIRLEREAQEAKLRAEAEAKRQQLLAPDKDKLLELALMFDSLQLPAVSSKEAMSVIRATEEMVGKVSNYIREKAKTL